MDERAAAMLAFNAWDGRRVVQLVGTPPSASSVGLSSHGNCRSLLRGRTLDLACLPISMVIVGALPLLRSTRHGRGRRRRWHATARRAQSDEQNSDGEASNARGRLSVVDVERHWEEARALGASPDDIANQCAVLCCVQRQLGYFAALHEGAVGKFSVVNKAPPLPFVLTWEGAGGIDDIYGMSLTVNGAPTLLQQLLGCVKQSQSDHRFGAPAQTSQVKAKVSLLHGFSDISATPTDWVPGTHGLWYCGLDKDGGLTEQVYVPEVVQSVAGDKGISQVLSVFPLIGADDGAEAVGTLPEGHILYRFEAFSGVCPVGNLPTMKTRAITPENAKEALLAQARIGLGDETVLDSTNVRFAALTAKTEDPRVRAFIVPPSGIYSNSHLSLAESLGSSPAAGLDRIRRIFVLAPVWDCYIDGCGLPERRCAWYGKMPLDLVVLERLRSSKAFTELTVEQDMRERAIEVLLPLVGCCLDRAQEFTLVPVLVGGLMAQKAEDYTKILAPYLEDPSNLFVVAGNVGELGETVDSSRRWTQALPTLVNREEGGLTPVFDALELFLTVLAQTPEREQLRFSRRW
mmetsp:Transcript_62487/g.182661  ORF Transcript_62487/g.182661 Transcript_62487/m.182661 type:complete len:575 (+) Transcript_62487:90-1814(+)